MTEPLRTLLDELANERDLPPLDMARIRATARRRSTRRRLLAGLAALAILGTGAAAALSVGGRHEALQPAEPSPQIPTDARLLAAVQAAFPGAVVPEVQRQAAGPMTRGSSLYYAPGRSLLHDELWFITGRTADGRGLTLHWLVVDPAMTDEEVDRYARGVVPPDPDPVPVPESVRIDTGHANAGALKSVLYARDVQIVSYAWSSSGALVTATLSGAPHDLAQAHALDALTRRLAGPDGADSAPMSQAMAYPVAEFSQRANALRLPAFGDATVGDLAGPRLVGCISVGRAVELASRDFTSDLDERGETINPRAIVRVVADGTLATADGPTAARAIVLFDAGTGHVVSLSSQRFVENGPALPPLDPMRADEQPCPSSATAD